MPQPLTAAEWLVLDNIAHGWLPETTLTHDVATATLATCEAKGYLAGGQLTTAGKTALAATHYFDR